MDNVLLALHIVLAVFLIGVVLLQRSEGGALGIGGGGGGFMSGRSAGSALTRTTVILAVGFFATSIGLGLMARSNVAPAKSVTETAAPADTTPTAPAPDGADGSKSGESGESKTAPQPDSQPAPPEPAESAPGETPEPPAPRN